MISYRGEVMFKTNKLLNALIVIVLTIVSVGIIAISQKAEAVDNGHAMYRLYNPNSGEHFYTSSEVERNSLITAGWNYEGFGFIAINEGEPVYRLYNGNSGDHHYTLSSVERDHLIGIGWSDEGIGWFSKTEGSSCEKIMYRLYNPNASTATHHYTLSEAERDSLVSIGWKYEGTSWTSMHNVGPGEYVDSEWNRKGSSGQTTCAVCGQVFGGPLGDDYSVCLFDLPLKPECTHKNIEPFEYVVEAYLNLPPYKPYLKSLGWYYRCKDCGKRSVDGQHNWMTIEEWSRYFNVELQWG